MKFGRLGKINRNGFTLLELLVVISIIGILSSLVMVSFPGATKSARDGKRKEELGQYRIAVENFANRGGGIYPVANPAINAQSLCGTGAQQVGNINCTSDPKIGSSICGLNGTASCQYRYYSNGTDYVIWAGLEKPADKVNKPCFVTCSNGLSGEAACPTTACTL